MTAPGHLRFAASHEWFDEATGAVGISDHAQAELSDVVYVELPQVGRRVSAGEAVGAVESVKASSEIYAPVAGLVTAVNADLAADPSLVNNDPYGEGWLFKLEPDAASAGGGAGLLTASEYAASIGG
jgi:glycine cleavage system H protein